MLDFHASVVLFFFFNGINLFIENQYCSHIRVCPSEDIYTHQMDVLHDIQLNAEQGHGIRLRIRIVLLL